MELQRYEVIGASYFETAPVRLDERIELGYPRDVVWKIFEDNSAWEAFEFGIEQATWTSPLPLRPGSTRRVRFSRRIGGGMVDEVFFEWKPNERFAFFMQQGTSRLIRAYGEMWSVTDLPGGRSELRCRTAFALNGRFSDRIAHWLSPVLRLGYAHVLESVKQYLDRQPVAAADPVG